MGRFSYQHPTLLYQGKRFQVYQVEQQLEDKVVKRELVAHPGAVAILPFLDAETILLIKNERFSVQDTLLELPAGTLEPDEPTLECAYRELEEETGYKASKMELLLEFFPTPGYCNEIFYSFVAQGLTKTAQHLDETERIEVVPTTFKDALTAIREGKIRDAKTITTLLYYAQFKMTPS